MTDTNSFPHSPQGRRVSLTRGEWYDAARDRTIPYKLYMPDGDDALPLIIWSHGLGGTRDGAGFLARFIADQGYAHLHIQHDGTDDSLWRNRRDLHPWDAIREQTPLPWETVRNRYHDVPFIVNQLHAGTALDSAVMARLDLDNMGLCGHSFGALTTQIIAGQWTGVSDDTREQITSDAFKTGIAYSPSPNIRLSLPDKVIYGDFHMPILFMTGTNDDSPLQEFTYQHRVNIYENAGGHGHGLMVMKGADHMVYNGSRGQLKGYDGIALHEKQICLASLVWWNAHLKNDASAQEWLANDGLNKIVQLTA